MCFILLYIILAAVELINVTSSMSDYNFKFMLIYSFGVKWLLSYLYNVCTNYNYREWFQDLCESAQIFVEL